MCSRAEFYRRTDERRDILSSALGGGKWECAAALVFLAAFPDDVPELLDQLVCLATSPAWCLEARRAIAAGRREIVSPRILGIVNEVAIDADVDDFRRLAELLVHLGESDSLALLLGRARNRDDPEFHEVIDDFSSCVEAG